MRTNVLLMFVIMGNENLQHHERKTPLYEGRFSDEDGVRAELEGEFAELVVGS